MFSQVIIRKHLSQKEIKAHKQKEKKKIKDQMKAKGKQKKKRQESDTEDEDDEVPIRTPDYEEFHFPCNKWLDSKEGDGETERTLKCKKKQLHYEGGVNQGKLFIYHSIYMHGSNFDKLKDENHFLWYIISKIQYYIYGVHITS